MEDSIKSSFIHNRKIVIEIRYDSNPLVIDKRGLLVKKLIDLKVIPEAQWELGIGEVKISDSLSLNYNRQIIYIDLHRISVISSKIETNESFYHLFDKVFKIFKEVIPIYKITRVGCRIQGTYQSLSTEFNKVVENFKKIFPSQILLEDYNIKDMRFQLIYQNGQYHIGPINKDDNFIKTEFPYIDAIKKVGFAIDTDNYVVQSPNNETIQESVIKDVYITSLSVEKSLFDKLHNSLK